MLHDLRDLFSIAAADLVDLLDETTVRLHESRVETVLLGEAFEVGHADAGVEVVGTGCEDVFPRTGILVGHDRIDVRIEEHRLETFQERVNRFACLSRELRARLLGDLRSSAQRLRSDLEHEFPCRQVVVRAGVDPEQFGVALDLAEGLRLDAFGMRDDRLENAPHLERVAVLLVVEDVATGERRLHEVIRQRLLSQWQRGELIGIQLDDCRIVHSLEQILALRRGRRARRWSRCRGFGALRARARRGDEQDEGEEQVSLSHKDSG